MPSLVAQLRPEHFSCTCVCFPNLDPDCPGPVEQPTKARRTVVVTALPEYTAVVLVTGTQLCGVETLHLVDHARLRAGPIHTRAKRKQTRIQVNIREEIHF